MARRKSDTGLDSATEKLLSILEKRISASTRSSRELGRVSYIIGNNGTGKSRVLGTLAQRLRDTRPLRQVACIASSIYDRFTFGENGNVHYLGARSATNAVFLSASDRQLVRLILKSMTLDFRHFSALRGVVKMDFVFNFNEDIEKEIEELLGDVSSKGSKRSREKLSRLLESKQSLAILRRIIDGTRRFDDLTKAQIRTLLSYVEAGLEIRLDVRFPDGTLMNFGALSTGEQNRVLVLAKVLSLMVPGAVFLIDEPEVSLHLHWQMKFHETLLTLLSELPRFHVVIATHAPVVISEAAKFDPSNDRNLVAILRRNSGDGEEESHGDMPFGTGNVVLETHNFAQVSSHDQLILRYFQSSPYRSREISVEIADTVLHVVEGTKAVSEAESLLDRLKATKGLAPETLSQIDEAISLIRRDWVQSIHGGEPE